MSVNAERLKEVKAYEEVEAVIRARRVQFGLGITRYAQWMCLLVVVVLVVGWLPGRIYSQLLVTAVMVTLLGAASWGYGRLSCRGRAVLAAYILLVMVVATTSAIPFLLRNVAPVFSIAAVTAIVMTFQLLGGRHGLWFVGLVVAFFGATLVLSNNWHPDWAHPIDEDLDLFIGTILSIITMATTVIELRIIITGQEENYRQAQRASLEIEKRAAVEQEQREALEQANAEIQQRIEAEQENRAQLEQQREALEQANAEIQQRIEAEQEQHAKLEKAYKEIEARAVNEQTQREYLQATVERYVDYMQAIGRGNLSRQLKLTPLEDNPNDPLLVLGHSLNEATTNLQSMIVQMRDAAAAVAAAAAEIQAATSQQLASNTELEAAVAQTMTTVEEVRETVQQTAERAQAVAQVSAESIDVSRSGQTAVTDTVSGMETVRQRVEDIAENILMLSERTQQIGAIIQTVNEIADQSKMLALNASIEAARAGEEGKGFGVVALEVRQLAEQSRAATAQVKDILYEIQQATNTAVMVTEEGSKGADSGVTLAERAGKSIRELAETIESSAQAATQIAASTYQQTNGMDQLAAAMASIKQASAQAAASTTQAERSAHDLLDMARTMETIVEHYRLEQV
jgi:methyl-accepting chemotaxis protein